jgi:hypothetical protein
LAYRQFVEGRCGWCGDGQRAGLWKLLIFYANGLAVKARPSTRFEMLGHPAMAEVFRPAIPVIDRLRLFGIGAAWGGCESLLMIADMEAARTVSDWRGRSPLIRLHLGLASVAAPIADLEQALAG